MFQWREGQTTVCYFYSSHFIIVASRLDTFYTDYNPSPASSVKPEQLIEKRHNSTLNSPSVPQSDSQWQDAKDMTTTQYCTINKGHWDQAQPPLASQKSRSRPARHWQQQPERQPRARCCLQAHCPCDDHRRRKDSRPQQPSA